MRINLGLFRENYDMAGLITRLREVFRDIESAFERIKLNGALVIGGGTVIEKYVSATRSAVTAADYSANPILANSTATFTVTVPGVTVDDEVTAVPNGSLGAGLFWSAYPGVDLVNVVVANVTAGNIVPTTRDWRVSVIQH